MVQIRSQIAQSAIVSIRIVSRSDDTPNTLTQPPPIGAPPPFPARFATPRIGFPPPPPPRFASGRIGPPPPLDAPCRLRF